MASYEVFVTEEADLDEIVEYVEFRDSAERLDYLYEQLKQAILKVEVLPERGRVVPELREIAITEFRQILHKPYRILYFIAGKPVTVHGVFDCRRGIAELLSRRLLRQSLA